MNSKLAFCVIVAGSFAGVSRADILDLSGATLTGSRNGATFTVYDSKSAGTGVLKPFLRIQNDKKATTCGADNKDHECGYNTNGTKDSKTDDKDDKTDSHTHAVAMSDYTGTFLLDINEPGSDKAYLSLDQLQIYGANVADIDAASTTFTKTPAFPTGILSNPNLTLLWDLDGATANTDYTIFLKDRFSGSGATDLKIDIPESLFYHPAGNYKYLVLFANMGNVDTGGHRGKAEGGFEEFAIPSPPTPPPNPIISLDPVPEPTSMLLLATVSVWTLIALRKKLARN